MTLWTFDEYVELSGKAPFSEWFQSLESGACSFIDVRLLYMSGMAIWPEKWASKYHGTETLIELRIPFNKVQYRPLGMYSPWEQRHFVLLSGAIEKGRIRSSVISVAAERAKRVIESQRYVRRYQYD